MTSSEVRVRIGPSPTGEPHVGTAYVALFNYAVAKQLGGTFVLRIEDTDQERSRAHWAEEIMAGLKWLGLSWDEGPDVGGPHGPYRQSERHEIYRAHAERLIESGHAYRCFCTRARLDALRAEQKAQKLRLGYDGHCRRLAPDMVAKSLAAGTPYTVRMAAPEEGITLVPDELRGNVEFDNRQMDDQVLLKSDGFPTYHLASVVDDHLMKISHVIRAEEWISSTPKHVALYKMFGWSPPKFFHLPLLRNADRSKISKRKNPVSVLDYRARGYLPSALLNYLAMLGWTMPDGREVFSLDDFVENFSWSEVNLGGPVFDLEKLTWLNGKYYREVLSEEALCADLRAELLSPEYLGKIVPLLRERIDKAEDFVPAASYFFEGELRYDPELLRPKKRSWKELREALDAYLAAFEVAESMAPDTLEEAARTFAKEIEWKTGELFMALRIVATGRKASPPLFDTISVLGRARMRRRLRAASNFAREQAKAENR